MIMTIMIIIENKNENKNENENENENNYEKKNENETDNMKKENINNWLDGIIGKTKSFEDQITLFKKVKDLEPWFMNNYGDEELKFKIFKLKLADLSNIIDEKLFEQIFGYTFLTLANKLINTTNKEKNQIIVNDIEKNKYKLFEEKDDDDHYVIQSRDQRTDLFDAVNFILNFNETIQLDLV